MKNFALVKMFYLTIFIEGIYLYRMRFIVVTLIIQWIMAFLMYINRDYGWAKITFIMASFCTGLFVGFIT
ncbi:MAG: hypothetical protein E7678_06955 [Ruminococcaceae bacterium]|nr:hypothetical protein [Oscillospiraceae bacterium]